MNKGFNQQGGGGNFNNQQPHHNKNNFGGGGGRNNNDWNGGRNNNGRFRGGRGKNFGGRQGGNGQQQQGGQQMPNNNDPNQQGFLGQEQPIYQLCKFFLKDNNCSRGNNCRFAHGVVSKVLCQVGHTEPIKGMGLLNMEDGPKIFTGSSDSTVKIWNLNSPIPTSTTMPVTGKVNHIQIQDSSLLWSVDEALDPEHAELPVGVVYLCNIPSMASIPIKRSEALPYTHPQPIMCFTLAIADGITYVVTAGGEGNIRTWKFDLVTRQFEHLAVLEGHTRMVTSLRIVDTHENLWLESCLWSGSIDRTIRVWDIGTANCIGVLTNANGGYGHSDSVSALESIPASNTPGAQHEAYVASGGADFEVKLWKTNGEFLHTCSHGAIITSMKTFQDGLGGVQCLIIALFDGKIIVRACVNMNLIFVIDALPNINTKAIWAITPIPPNFFATAGDDGMLVVWKIEKPLVATH